MPGSFNFRTMKAILNRRALLCALVLSLSPAASFLHAATPAEELAELMKEAQGKGRQGGGLAPKFLAFAERNIKDPAAADALAWVINKVEFGQEFEAAADLYAKNHAASDKAGSVLDMLGDSDADAAARCLRAILAKNANKSVQAGATYYLALWLYVESERVARVDGATASLKVAGESEKFYTQLIEKHADSRYVGKARKELNTLRTVGIGRPAPEIEGEDHKGERFKLSESRGKVTMIVFWGDW